MTGARGSFWTGLFVARLDGENWPTCVKFAHEVANLKLGVDGHIEGRIDQRDICDRLDEAVGHKV